MSAALVSLLALIAAIALSMTTRINVGIVAMVFAWIVGVYAGHLTVDTVIRGFPSGLFLTLTGMSLLFAAAEANGTLENVARRAVRLTRGRAALLPRMFFAAPARCRASPWSRRWRWRSARAPGFPTSSPR